MAEDTNTGAAALDKKTITLPSRGLLYEGKIPEGKVGVRKLTAAEINTLFGSSGDETERVNKIISASVSLPSNFAHKDLLVVDRMYLLLALRSITYGPHYSYEFKCRDCGHKNRKVSCNIAQELEEHKASDSFAEPLEIKLPESGRTLSMRFMRGYDEEAVIKHAKRMEMTSIDGEDPSALHRVARLIKAIDGNDPGDIVTRERFVAGLPAGDFLLIEDTVDEAEPGVDLRVYPECQKCKSANEMRLPFTLEFFRPASRRS